MTVGISFIICCYNSAKRLPETLEHLGRMQLVPDLPVEIIVIDNASTDNTAEVAVQFCPANLREFLQVILEPKPGKSRAFYTGIHAARYEIACIIDDDNWVCQDWCIRVWKHFSEHQDSTVLGCRSIPVFEQPAPDWIHPLLGFYALGAQHAFSGEITKEKGTLLWGAGTSLRSSQVRQLFTEGFCFLMSQNAGKAVGEDTELCFALRASGLRLWYDDGLTLQHFVPAERLTWSYAKKLMYEMGAASFLIDGYLIALNKFPHDKPNQWKKTWTFQMLKTLKGFLKFFLLDPSLFFVLTEGKRSVLDRQFAKGKLDSILLHRKKYNEIIRSIRDAKWNKMITK